MLACTDSPFMAPTPTPTPTDTSTPTPTNTPTFTATHTPTVTLTPTPTITPTTSYLDWPVVFFEDFGYDNGGWTTGKGSDEKATWDISITEGKYLVKITSRVPVFFGSGQETHNLFDFFLSVEVQKIKSPDKTDYGLYFRNRQENFYYFYINALAKQYGLSMDFNNQMDGLIYWTDSDRIDPDGSNQLAVLAQGSHYTLFINGAEVNSFDDDMLSEGFVGVAYELYQGGEYLKLAFDNFKIAAPKNPL